MIIMDINYDYYNQIKTNQENDMIKSALEHMSICEKFIAVMSLKAVFTFIDALLSGQLLRFHEASLIYSDYHL